jgi:hypothetical protein
MLLHVFRRLPPNQPQSPPASGASGLIDWGNHIEHAVDAWCRLRIRVRNAAATTFQPRCRRDVRRASHARRYSATYPYNIIAACEHNTGWRVKTVSRYGYHVAPRMWTVQSSSKAKHMPRYLSNRHKRLRTEEKIKRNDTFEALVLPRGRQ